MPAAARSRCFSRAASTWSAASFRVCVATDDVFVGRDCAQLVQRALQGGATAIRFRALRLQVTDTRRFMALGEELRELTASHGVPLIVDERVDIALAIGADGVHLGQTDMPPAAARRHRPGC